MATPSSQRGRVVVFGVTSPIGRAVAARFARDGHPLVVTGRPGPELDRIASDLRLRTGQTVEAHGVDALSRAELADWWRKTCVEGEPGQSLEPPEGVVVCWGDMPEQDEGQREAARLCQMIDVNVAATFVVMEAVAATLEAAGRGFLCVVTSVAGDRGRPSNYLYGATKAAQSTALEGMRVRLGKRGVAVVDVRPGFVDTGLTWGRPGVFLAASPDSVAASIERAVRKGRGVVYTPFFWRFIMLAIRMIPGPLFRRLSL